MKWVCVCCVNWRTPLEKLHTFNSLRAEARGTRHKSDPPLNLPLTSQLLTLIITKWKACERRNEAQLANFMQKMDNAFMPVSFRKKTAEFSHFPFKEQMLPRRQLSLYSDLSCSRFGKFANPSVCWKSLCFAHCLFVHAYGFSQVLECLLKVLDVCASLNPCLSAGFNCWRWKFPFKARAVSGQLYRWS